MAIWIGCIILAEWLQPAHKQVHAMHPSMSFISIGSCSPSRLLCYSSRFKLLGRGNLLFLLLTSLKTTIIIAIATLFREGSHRLAVCIHHSNAELADHCCSLSRQLSSQVQLLHTFLIVLVATLAVAQHGDARNSRQHASKQQGRPDVQGGREG
jgi:hypothetical protein